MMTDATVGWLDATERPQLTGRLVHLDDLWPLDQRDSAH
jgi:hypothetical protein